MMLIKYCSRAVRRLFLAALTVVPIAGCNVISSPIKQMDCTIIFPDGKSQKIPPLIFNEKTFEIYRYDSFSEKLIPDSKVYVYEGSKEKLEPIPSWNQEIAIVNNILKLRSTGFENAYEMTGPVEVIEEYDFKTLKLLRKKSNTGEDFTSSCKWGTPKTTLVKGLVK